VHHTLRMKIVQAADDVYELREDTEAVGEIPRRGRSPNLKPHQGSTVELAVTFEELGDIPI